jgi:poly(A) polymerase
MREAAVEIVKRLREAGHLAFFVGGCVRDLIMGIAPKDYDIATSARPEQVMRLFPQSLAVGAQFGVVLVVQEGRQYEVATFRSDGTYMDGRHPDQVTYADDPRHDVLRRDFTINGLLYDPLRETVLDFVEGQRDIRGRIIRTIGNAEQRFLEDKLRLIRAVRFASRFVTVCPGDTSVSLIWLYDRKPTRRIGEPSRFSPKAILPTRGSAFDEFDCFAANPRPGLQHFEGFAAPSFIRGQWLSYTC